MRKTILKVLSSILIFQMMFFSAARADEYSLEKLGSQYGTRSNFTSPLKLQRGAISKTSLQFAAHHGQAILLILILTGVDLVKQHVQHARRMGEKVDRQLLMRHAGEAAETIVASGEIWMSFLGASVTSGALAKPLQIFDQLLATAGARGLFKDLLRSGIMTWIMFAGWEMGGELFRMAVGLIDNEAERLRAEMLLPLLVRAMFVRGGIQENVLASDREILHTVTRNMIDILVLDHDLRNLWLYNVWRKRIATGEFATLVIAMTSASVVGSTLWPGAGTFAGMMFGLVGGVVTLFVPEPAKDGITGIIQNVRASFWRIGDDQGPLFSVKKDIVRVMLGFVAKDEDLPPLLVFRPDPKAREKQMNIHFERIFKFESRIQAAMVLRDDAERTRQEQTIIQAEREIEINIAVFRSELEEMKYIYRDEIREIDEAMNDDPAFRDADKLRRYPELQLILDYRARLACLDGFMHFFVEQVDTHLLVPERPYVRALLRFYLFGYSEDMLLELLR